MYTILTKYILLDFYFVNISFIFVRNLIRVDGKRKQGTNLKLCIIFV